MKTIGLIILLVYSNFIYAFSTDISFKHLSSKDGLQSDLVNVIMQDSYGYMWFGTESGLSRYDGYTISSFTHNSTDFSSISNSYIYDILEDTIRGNLWVATHNGLNYYDYSKGIFSEYSFEQLGDTGSNFQTITDLFLGVDHSLWVVRNNKIIRIGEDKKMTILFNPENDNLSGSINKVMHWKDNLYFILKSDGLFSFDINNKVLEKVIDGQLNCSLKDSNGDFWFGTRKNGLWYLPNSSNDEFEYVLLDNGKDKGGFIRAIEEDAMGRIWVGERDKGIKIINPQNNERLHLSHKVNNPNGLRSNAIQTMYVDNHKNVWVGTSDAGISFFDNQKKAFTQYNYNYDDNKLKNTNTRSMYQDSDGDIWIGTKVDGCLSKFDKKKGTFEHFEMDLENPYSLNDDFVFSIVEDRPGYLWIGTFHGGLNLFEKKTGKFTHYTHDPEDPNSVSENAIYTLCKDSKGRLWVGTDFGGVDVFDENMRKKNYKSDPNNLKSISSDRIKYIFEDRDHKIWIGTMSGLNLYNEESDDFNTYLNDEQDITSISHNSISCIYEDSKKRFWVATFGGGLNLMDKEHGTFTHFSKSDGLANNILLGIIEDEKGDLWISTINGISKFISPLKIEIISKSTFKNYDGQDGLYEHKYNINAFLKTNDGEMLFGGSNGFSVFDPGDIRDNQIMPIVQFTDLKLFNKSAEIGGKNSPLTKHINTTNELILNQKQSIFTISYVALNYSSPEKNQYAYIMEGLEPNWNYVGNRREATYTNLDPGTYTFKVKASNNDGVWNEVGTSISIKILQHPFLTVWAYCVYFVLLFALALYLRYRFLRKMKADKKQESDQDKLKFFINISHEFRTPLTLILNPIDKIMSTVYPVELENPIQNIHRNTHRLLRLVDQLLDYRKSELGKLTLRVVHVDIVKFTKEFILLFEELAKAKNIEIDFNDHPSSIMVWVDPDKYEKIINNLLSNAIKFCRDLDKISISLSVVELSENPKKWRVNEGKKASFVMLKVADTGIGISKKNIDNIFDRFQSGNQVGTGTGIGLNYIKGLIEMHHGTIEVESEHDKGTTFAVCLPLDNAHLKEEQMSQGNFEVDKFSFNVSNIESVRYEVETSDTSIVEKEVSDNDLMKNKTVLIVEDNKDLRNQIKEELQNSFIVKEAINGLNGWQKTEKFFPDIIISDVMMPIMDGIELCGKIKSDLNTSHIPVILLTARSLVEHRIEGYEMGADEYIVKPFSMDVLKARINNILESRKKLKEKYFSSNTLTPASELTHNNKDEIFLGRITNIVLDNISNPDFGFNELLEHVALSRSSFYRKITALTSMSPSLFIRNLRIKYAADLLLKNELTVKEVCYLSGFNSPSHFSRIFRKTFGQSPVEFIEENSKLK